MIEFDDYREERSCTYKNEEYLVRDNGAVLRKTPFGKRARKWDDKWTFGTPNIKTGYLGIASVRVHRIVAVAFHGEPPTDNHVVDHIDTNRQNNRPSNLRWVTRLENVLLNETTRKKVEYCTGVSIDEFLKDPAKYRELLKGADLDWMRRVEEDEEWNCLENLKKWGRIKSQPTDKATAKIGEWIYKEGSVVRGRDLKNTQQISRVVERIRRDVTDSLTAMAKQRDWKTPVEFLCCPDEVCEDPIREYAEKMAEGAVFSKNQYGESRIVKFATFESKKIVVITSNPSNIKPFALAKITYEEGYYVHKSIGTFFERVGAEKRFALEQGLTWIGGETVDDHM